MEGEGEGRERLGSGAGAQGRLFMMLEETEERATEKSGGAEQGSGWKGGCQRSATAHWKDLDGKGDVRGALERTARKG